MTEFEKIRRAFAASRSRASVASHAEARLLHMAAYDAREAGLSVREAAAALRVSKSTLARHWREGHRCSIPAPMWGTPEEYIAAERAIWAHAPEEVDERVPYEWEDLPEGARTTRCVPLGTVTLCTGSDH